MKILLVAATKAELNTVFEYFNLSAQDFVEHPKFDIIITGVGMTATAFTLGKHLKRNYSLVINVGIAGSFDQNIPLGSVVNVYEDIFAELGAEDHDDFIAIDELGFGKNTYYASHQISSLPNVKGITVNRVHGNAKSIETIKTRLNPQVESMEGAAIFYVCEQLNVPCLQVRSISNYVEPRAKENWEIGLAIKNLNDWLINFLTSYTHK